MNVHPAARTVSPTRGRAALPGETPPPLNQSRMTGTETPVRPPPMTRTGIKTSTTPCTTGGTRKTRPMIGTDPATASPAVHQSVPQTRQLKKYKAIGTGGMTDPRPRPTVNDPLGGEDRTRGTGTMLNPLLVTGPLTLLIVTTWTIQLAPSTSCLRLTNTPERCRFR